jgi:hypothetical protein
MSPLGSAVGALFAGLLILNAWTCSAKKDAQIDAHRAQTALERFRAEVAEQAVARAFEIAEDERTAASRLADIGSKHEEDRRDAESVPAAVVADLRSGARRLQEHWAACETSRLSDAATASRERDSAAQRREADIGNLVRVGRDADDQLRACQAVIESDRSD